MRRATGRRACSASSSRTCRSSLPTIERFRGRGNGTKELTIPELARIGRDARAPAARRDAARANFHFRMVEVAMMLLVPLLAVSLAVPPKRSTSGLGIFVALIFVVTYHKVNQQAESLGALGRVDPLDRALGALPALRRR